MGENEAKRIGEAIGATIKRICYFLTILFCALRACGIINWHCFWIMSPIFASWGIVILMLMLMGIIKIVETKRKAE